MRSPNTIQKINETDSCIFFEKINKIYKTLTRLFKKRETAHVNIIRNEKECTTEITEIQRTVRDNYKQLYANEKDNLEEMDKFLESCNTNRQEKYFNTGAEI